MQVEELLGNIPTKLTERLAQNTKVDHKVKHLRGAVMLNLLLLAPNGGYLANAYSVHKYMNDK